MCLVLAIEVYASEQYIYLVRCKIPPQGGHAAVCPVLAIEVYGNYFGRKRAFEYSVENRMKALPLMRLIVINLTFCKSSKAS